MPRCLEPGQNFSIVLESDRDKPADKQPRYIFRVLNGRQWRHAAEESDRLRSGSATGAMDSIFNMLSSAIVGWENMIDPATGESIPFKAADIDLVADPNEAGELLGGLMLSLTDKKKSDLRPLSGQESSAPDVVPVSV